MHYQMVEAAYNWCNCMARGSTSLNGMSFITQADRLHYQMSISARRAATAEELCLSKNEWRINL